MSQSLLERPVSLVGPSYNVYRYTDQIYKVVHFKQPRLLVATEKPKDKSRKGNTDKLDAAISRAKRTILEYALCNQWEWFCTFTLDQTKYDRYNLKTWYKEFTQWIRDQRKKYKKKFQYLLIPELHKNGAWHMHALFYDVATLESFRDLRQQGWKVPDLLVDRDYYCWVDYHNKFGFCSFGAVKDPVAAGFYITKYMSKTIGESAVGVGAHLYYASHGLNRATLHTDIYGECEYLDQFLTNKYEWVETGMTRVEHGLDWTFALAEGGLAYVYGHDYGQEVTSYPNEFDYAFDAVQQMIEGF